MEFTVTAEMDDDSEPWVKLYYGAEEDEETCRYEAGDPNCYNDFWWVKIRMSDEGDDESGLNEITITPEGQNIYDQPIYYRYSILRFTYDRTAVPNGNYSRYPNFPIGTTLEQELIASASCCIEKMVIRVTDVAGNVGEVRGTQGGTGAKHIGRHGYNFGFILDTAGPQIRVQGIALGI